MMKKLNNKLAYLFITAVGLSLAACNSGSTSPASGSQNNGTANNVINNNSSESSLPQVSVSDLQQLFNALATDSAKTTISLESAVAIITGKDQQGLASLRALNLAGYASALKAIESVPHVSLNSLPTQAQYNEALFAALFLGDVTDSSSGSDGTSSLGQITWNNTLATLAMVSHRFFGGYRLPEQDYTWSFNPGTLETVVNTPDSVGTLADIDFMNVHQGAVGDCYYLSTLSALIYQRGAGAVLNRFHQNSDGSYAIDYTSVHSVASQVTVSPVTDLEIATGAYSAGSGQWLSYLEKAYGDVLMSPEYSFIYFGSVPVAPGSIYDLATFYDGMTASQLPVGQYYPAFKFLTGHEVYEFDTVSNTDNTLVNLYAANPDSNNLVLGKQLSPADMVNLIDISLAAGRVMVLGTPIDTKELNGTVDSTAVNLPPGIVGTHAYAVLGHANGLFKLRNPWGTNFTPAGADGIVNGYTMNDGVFYVPDADVFKIFDQIDIEQIPGLDKTPIVINGVVQKDANGNPLYTEGSNPVMDAFVTSNGAYIKNNYSSDIAMPESLAH